MEPLRLDGVAMQIWAARGLLALWHCTRDGPLTRADGIKTWDPLRLCVFVRVRVRVRVLGDVYLVRETVAPGAGGQANRRNANGLEAVDCLCNFSCGCPTR